MRKIIFANDECYHVYNRGVDKRKIFLIPSDFKRFLLGIDEFNDENLTVSLRDKQNTHSRSHASGKDSLVEVIAYCLNSNHYHFILKQLKERGIERFMHRLGTSYSKYFNIKNERSGTLFQGPFKAIHIDSNEYLLYLSVYVNANNFIHGYSKDKNWKFSSLLDYIGERNERICKKELVLSQFRNKKDYEEFLNKNALHLKEKKELEKYLLEE